MPNPPQFGWSGALCLDIWSITELHSIIDRKPGLLIGFGGTVEVFSGECYVHENEAEGITL
jgi:hypothetical protein